MARLTSTDVRKRKQVMKEFNHLKDPEIAERMTEVGLLTAKGHRYKASDIRNFRHTYMRHGKIKMRKAKKEGPTHIKKEFSVAVLSAIQADKALNHTQKVDLILTYLGAVI